jgi:formylglycine-generating enzyme required for sulfatase activity
LIPLIFLALGSVFAAEPPYPLWDGHESVVEYAKKVNLPPSTTLDLGNNVKLELVLIPAGRFIMGTPGPPPVDEDSYRKQIMIGKALLLASGGVLLVILAIVVIRAIRNKHRPQLSLGLLILMTLAAGGGVLSSLHWRQSAQALQTARIDYQKAKAHIDWVYQSERPAHPVTLSRPFYMAKFPVTQEQYAVVQGTNPSAFSGKDNPVEMVSCDDAQDFCKKLAAKTKQEVRLPTEAQWEHACRAGSTTTYYSGDTDSDLDRVAWYSSTSTHPPQPVGQKQPNTFGLYDMHGNVFQWCQDWWEDNYYGKSPSIDPEGPAQGEDRLLRGGCWCTDSSSCRSAYRSRYGPGYRCHYIGFRVVVVCASGTP